jgi:hypothetical protein
MRSKLSAQIPILKRELIPMSPLHHLPRVFRYFAITLSPLLLAPSVMASGFTALSGDYYKGYFYGDPGFFSSNTKAFTRQDSFIAFINGSLSPYSDWDFTGTPLDGVTDDFSVRWTGSLQVDTDGTYSFQTVSDDGIIVYLDNTVIISNPTEHGDRADTATLLLSAGSHPFEILYGERGGNSKAHLQWQKPGDTNFSTIESQQVPGPLPLLGLATAFKTSRILRRRLKARIS